MYIRKELLGQIIASVPLIEDTGSLNRQFLVHMGKACECFLGDKYAKGLAQAMYGLMLSVKRRLCFVAELNSREAAIDEFNEFCEACNKSNRYFHNLDYWIFQSVETTIHSYGDLIPIGYKISEINDGGAKNCGTTMEEIFQYLTRHYVLLADIEGNHE